MKLELKHLAPYLPYEIKVVSNERYKNETAIITSLNYGLDQDLIMLQGCTEEFDFFEDKLEKVKLLLKPMDEAEDYFEKIYGCLEHQDVTNYLDADFLSEYNLEISEFKYWEAEYIPYGTLKVLLKHHFDVFGLIVEKLAVSCS